MVSTVEFEAGDHELHLLYSPRDDDQWVYAKFNRGEPLVIKGTFRLTRANLVLPSHTGGDDDDQDYPLRFLVARRSGDYFQFDPNIVEVGCPVFLHKDAKPNWRWFSAERSVSIPYVIAKLKPKRIVIGGPEPDAIPIEAYERLVGQFPTSTELKRYTLARVSSVGVGRRNRCAGTWPAVPSARSNRRGCAPSGGSNSRTTRWIVSSR